MGQRHDQLSPWAISAERRLRLPLAPQRLRLQNVDRVSTTATLAPKRAPIGLAEDVCSKASPY